MLKKIFIFIILIEIYFAMNYDEEINTTGSFTYKYYKPTYTLRTYKINKYKEYYEIYNMNITLCIYKGETQIKKLENNLEDAYYFKYNNNDVYYITAIYPSSFCELCGFIVSSEDHEFNILSDEYNTTLYFGRYRKFSLKIQNKENTPQFLEIIIRLKSGQYGIFNKAYFEEKGIAFNPINTSDYTYSYMRSNTSYPIIVDELIFKPEFMFQYINHQKYYYEVSIEVNYFNSYIISKNYTECFPKYTFDFYKINNPLNKFFYEISFSKDSLVYLMKSNVEKIKINSLSKYNINDYSILYFETNKNKGCFSIIFSDEKNTITSNTDFKLTLFDSRNYNVIITDNKKFIQINYIKNDYFNIHLYENQEIKYKFFKLNKYIFIFEKNSDEFPLQLQFEKNKEFNRDYYEIEFSYYGLDEDINIEIIHENTIKCVNKTTFYNLTFNPEKQYIYFISNDSSTVYLNDISINNVSNNNYFKLEKDENFDIYADNDKHINCFELKYEINNGSIINPKYNNKFVKSSFYFAYVFLSLDLLIFIGFIFKISIEKVDYNFFQILWMIIKLPLDLPWKKIGYVYFCKRDI